LELSSKVSLESWGPASRLTLGDHDAIKPPPSLAAALAPSLLRYAVSQCILP
jgi:hypothetical protein